MVRSYLTVFALLGLAAVVGCGDDDNGTGGTGGTAGTGGTGGTAGTGGTGGDGGTAGTGGTGGDGGAGFTKDISLGCTNSVTSDISILDWTLDVTPDGDVTGGATFDAELGGVAFFSESFLDAAVAALPGLQSVAVTALAATVLPRSGATGDPVVLGLDPSAVEYRCVFEGTCDPANTQENGSNTDCVPVVSGNRCLPFVDLPISEDCAAGGECETLGKATQCEAGDYCVTGPLPLDLEPATGSYTAEASGDILLGWDDQNTGATVAGDGTYDLPAALFADPVEPNGIRVQAGLSVALQCTMAVDSNGPDGVGVPDQASPTPDSALLMIPIQ